MGSADYGIDPKVINRLAGEVIEAQNAGAELALVIGGGNIFRVQVWLPRVWTASPVTRWGCWQQSSTHWQCKMHWKSSAPKYE